MWVMAGIQGEFSTANMIKACHDALKDFARREIINSFVGSDQITFSQPDKTAVKNCCQLRQNLPTANIFHRSPRFFNWQWRTLL